MHSHLHVIFAPTPKAMKINPILLSLPLLVVFAGCDSVLDVKPSTFSGSTTYYQNQDQFVKAINGVYASIQGDYASGGHLVTWGEMRSDNTTFQYNEADRGGIHIEAFDEFMVTIDNGVVNNLWASAYDDIKETNVILDRITDVSFRDEALKERIIGEAKFLRALSYFNLVRMFGGVPLMLHEVSEPSETFAEKRNSVDEVYQQIVNDLQDAIARLPESYSGLDIGRATEGAARMLLADVHITRKNWQDALTQLREVEAMGYSLLPNYADIFDPDNKNNAESIFEIQFDGAIDGEASNFIYRYAPFNSGTDIIPFGDLSFSSSGENIPTADLIRAYEPGDLRKDASIAWYVKEGNAQYTDVALGDSIPFVKKFWHPFDQPGRAHENFPVYRYAETLLMLAETLNELGQTGDAHQYINQVRVRADLDPLQGLSQDQMRDAIARERRVELAFENKRWPDLIRTGKAVEVMNAHGMEMRSRSPRLGAAYNVTENKLLLPIPEREMRLNPHFEQNPGW